MWLDEDLMVMSSDRSLKRLCGYLHLMLTDAAPEEAAPASSEAEAVSWLPFSLE